MKLVTCTIASIVTQKCAAKLALGDDATDGETEKDDEAEERILIPLNYSEIIEELVHMGQLSNQKHRRIPFMP